MKEPTTTNNGNTDDKLTEMFIRCLDQPVERASRITSGMNPERIAVFMCLAACKPECMHAVFSEMGSRRTALTVTCMMDNARHYGPDAYEVLARKVAQAMAAILNKSRDGFKYVAMVLLLLPPFAVESILSKMGLERQQMEALRNAVESESLSAPLCEMLDLHMKTMKT